MRWTAASGDVDIHSIARWAGDGRFFSFSCDGRFLKSLTLHRHVVTPCYQVVLECLSSLSFFRLFFDIWAMGVESFHLISFI